MDIVMIPIKDIKDYENNPRKNDKAVEYVARSICDFGFKQPIIIDKDNVIVCGHTRIKAAKQLKLKEVPCIVADDLTEEQIKAYRLVDNKVAELSEWDFDLLNLELDDILTIDMAEYDFTIPQIDEEEEEEPGKHNEAERTGNAKKYGYKYYKTT